MNEMEIPKGYSEILQQKLNRENDMLWKPHSSYWYIQVPGATLDIVGIVFLKIALKRLRIKF
jgi:hypothetical protein